MRKTPKINPRGLEKDTWNYRMYQIRCALGWTQKKCSVVMGIALKTIKRLESGTVVRPELATIASIKQMEEQYKDIIDQYKKAPSRWNRLRPYDKRWYKVWGVNLLPIEVRQPKDIETLEDMGTSSDNFYFGRKTRKRFQNTGLKPKEALRRERISQTMLKTFADRRNKDGSGSETQS